MNEACADIRSQLGPFIDGALPGEARRAVEAHLAACAGCRSERDALDRLARKLATAEQVTAPEGLWAAIEGRLDGPADIVHGAERISRAWLSRFASRGLAAAAVVLLAIGLGWVALNGGGNARAEAAQIDFAPLLQRADGDIGAGIEALMAAYGGAPISAEAVADGMVVRVHAPDSVGPDLKLAGRYRLNMGPSHSALAFHYTGASGSHLLLLQCPPDVRKDYGNVECMACSVGEHHGHGVVVGKLRLMHLGSDDVCICVVSTLDEASLRSALDAIPIDF